jgi:hypothetical protein
VSFPAAWERRHPGADETWAFDFFSDPGSVAGFASLAVLTTAGVAWFWAGLVGDGRPYLLVRDLEVTPPRLPGSREVRAEGLWADVNCETPFEHWSLGVEAFGVAMDAPDDALHGERGHRQALGLDLEWEAVDGLEGGEGGYRQPGTVHGQILVGGTDLETLAFEGHGWRRHDWGSLDLLRPRAWLGGWLEDGTPHWSDDAPDDAELRHRAPLLLESGTRVATLERSVCRFTGPGGRAGLGWLERLRPPTAPG